MYKKFIKGTFINGNLVEDFFPIH